MTPMPSEAQRSSVSLFVIPSSLASSCTRIFGAKFLVQSFTGDIDGRPSSHEPAGGHDSIGGPVRGGQPRPSRPQGRGRPRRTRAPAAPGRGRRAGRRRCRQAEGPGTAATLPGPAVYGRPASGSVGPAHHPDQLVLAGAGAGTRRRCAAGARRLRLSAPSGVDWLRSALRRRPRRSSARPLRSAVGARPPARRRPSASARRPSASGVVGLGVGLGRRRARRCRSAPRRARRRRGPTPRRRGPGRPRRGPTPARRVSGSTTHSPWAHSSPW